MVPFGASGVANADVPQGSLVFEVEVPAKIEIPSWHANVMFAPALSSVLHERSVESFDARRAAELLNSLAEGLAGSGAPRTVKSAESECVAS